MTASIIVSFISNGLEARQEKRDRRMMSGCATYRFDIPRARRIRSSTKEKRLNSNINGDLLLLLVPLVG